MWSTSSAVKNSSSFTPGSQSGSRTGDTGSAVGITAGSGGVASAVTVAAFLGEDRSGVAGDLENKGNVVINWKTNVPGEDKYGTLPRNKSVRRS